MIKIPLESAKKGNIIFWKDSIYNIKLIVISVSGTNIKTKKISDCGSTKWGREELEISSKFGVYRKYATAYSTETELEKETIKCKNNETVTIELRKT